MSPIIIIKKGVPSCMEGMSPTGYQSSILPQDDLDHYKIQKKYKGGGSNKLE